MYCSKKSCFNEPYSHEDNHENLCLDHFKEAREKLKQMPKIDYSKHQWFERRVKKKE